MGLVSSALLRAGDFAREAQASAVDKNYRASVMDARIAKSGEA